MEYCAKCNRNEEEVRLFDGVYVNEPIRICEKCALVEGVPIFKLPSLDQLKESEMREGVGKRLARLSGVKEDKKQEKSVFEELKDLEEQPELERPEELPIQLVDNFHWIIQHERRRKGMMHKHLAEAIGESEMALKLIERNNLPEGHVRIVKKLEQYLRVRLIQPTKIDEVRIDEPEPISSADRLVREDPTEKIKEQAGDEMVRAAIKTEHNPQIIKHEKVAGEPLRVIDFKKERFEGITVADLKEMHKRIDADFTQKSAEEVGREQLEDFGTEEVKIPEKGWYDSYTESKEKKSDSEVQKEGKVPENVPSIYDLAKKREYKRKAPSDSVMGSDIEIVDEDNPLEKA